MNAFSRLLGSNDGGFRPTDFVRTWQSRSLEDFMAAFGDTLFLLVPLDEPSGELATGLEEASTANGERMKPSENAIGYVTVATGNFTMAGLLEKGNKPNSQRRISLRDTKIPHHIVPIRKRPSADRPFSERVGLGRARNNDIVFRHASVSKFHAWFECDADGGFYLCDAKSTNHTAINGTKQLGRPPSRVQPGDLLQFGFVKTILADPETVWRLVTGKSE